MTSGTVHANGLAFGTLTWGEGPLVLCLHGFPDDARTWDVVGPAVAAAGFRVVAPYLRGYAPTALPAADADSRALGADVLALLDALAPGEPASVVGHDWGAEAAYAAVGLAPERIARLVTIAIPHRAAVPFTPGLAWALRHFVTLRLPGAEARFAADDLAGIAELWRRWSPTWRYTDAELDVVKATFRQPGVVHAALGYYRAAAVLPPDFLRAKVAVPTLCIAGADDPGVAPDVFERAGRHFTGGYAVEVVPGGHFCHRESPEATAAAIVRHLRGQATATSTSPRPSAA